MTCLPGLILILILILLSSQLLQHFADDLVAVRTKVALTKVFPI